VIRLTSRRSDNRHDRGSAGSWRELRRIVARRRYVAIDVPRPAAATSFLTCSEPGESTLDRDRAGVAGPAQNRHASGDIPLNGPLVDAEQNSELLIPQKRRDFRRLRQHDKPVRLGREAEACNLPHTLVATGLQSFHVCASPDAERSATISAVNPPESLLYCQSALNSFQVTASKSFQLVSRVSAVFCAV